jgi:hypothetical protein
LKENSSDILLQLLASHIFISIWIRRIFPDILFSKFISFFRLNRMSILYFSIKTNLVYFMLGKKKIFWERIVERNSFVKLRPVCVFLVSIYLTCDSTYHPAKENFHLFLCVFHLQSPHINTYDSIPFHLTSQKRIFFSEFHFTLFEFNEQFHPCL